MYKKEKISQIGRTRTWAEGYYLGTVMVDSDFDAVAYALDNPNEVWSGMFQISNSPYDGFVEGIKQTEDEAKAVVIDIIIQERSDKSARRLLKSILAK